MCNLGLSVFFSFVSFFYLLSNKAGLGSLRARSFDTESSAGTNPARNTALFCIAKALFSWQNFWQNATVVLSLLFDN
jgi:hypothetical protein